MLIVETYLDFSHGKGVGLFAKANILKGTKYWIRNEFFDKIFRPDDFEKLEKISIDYIQKHGFLEISGNWYLCGDNARFTNHSYTPNSENKYDSNNLVEYSYALQDIKIGEEIFCDYTKICEACKDGPIFI